VKFSDKVLGEGFKFRDYFASVGRNDKSPLDIKENKSADTILNSFYPYKIEFDADKLRKNCPFS